MTHTLPRAVAIGLVIVLVVASGPAAAQTSLSVFDDAEEPSIVTYGADGQPSFIVQLEDHSTDSLEDWANASDDRSVIRTDANASVAVIAAPRFTVTGSFTDRLRALSAMDGDALSPTDALADRSYVKRVSPNYRLTYADPVDSLAYDNETATPQIGVTALNDPGYPTDGVAHKSDTEQTTLADARAKIGADNVSSTGSGLTVAVIDTGTNVQNGQVFGNGTSGSTLRVSNASKNFIQNTTVNESGYDSVADGNGHGTWVASAIAANTTDSTHDGVAPDATVLALKALDDEGSGSTGDIAAAVRHAADHDADVISMSLGSQVYSPALADAIAYAYANGVKAVVLAAGNSRQTARWVASPADANASERIVTVGATNETGASAYFSQVGPDPGTTDNSEGASQGAGVDVAAPGMTVMARTPTDDGLVVNSTLSGTSMATPLVAGAVTVALANNSALANNTPAEIHHAVRESARPESESAVAEVGEGMVAADTLASGDYPATDQAAAMSDSAEQRDEFYRALSDSQGGVLPLMADVRPVAA